MTEPQRRVSGSGEVGNWLLVLNIFNWVECACVSGQASIYACNVKNLLESDGLWPFYASSTSIFDLRFTNILAVLTFLPSLSASHIV